MSARTRNLARRTTTVLAAAATAAALTALPANAATTTRTTSPAVQVCGEGSAVTHPTSMVLTCADNGEVAKNLKWTSWSATGATATGQVSWRSGAADLARATAWKSAGAQFVLTDPVAEPGQATVFTKLVLHVTGATPRGFMRDLTFDETPVPVAVAPPSPKLKSSALSPGIMHAAAASGTLGYAQIEGYWIAAGGPSSVAETAAAITGAESSFEPGIIQQGVDYCGAGADRAGWGLWQITCGNSVPSYGTDFQILDPWNNAEAAVSKYNADVAAGDNGFDPWSTYATGAYQNFLQSTAPATGLTDPGQYTQAGATPSGTPSSPAAAPGSTYGPAMPGTPETPTAPDGSHQASQVVDQNDGTVDLLYEGADGSLDHDWYIPGSSWAGPTSLGGATMGSEPSTVNTVAGTVDTFWEGQDGDLWHSFTTGGTWNAPVDLGYGTLGSAPRAIGQANGTIDVFWRGANDDHLWLAHYTAGVGWSSSARDLGGDIAAGTVPAPVTSADPTTDIFFEGTDGNLWHVFSNDYGQNWSGAASLGMGSISQPLAAGQTDGTIDVFWKGTADNHMWHAFFNTGGGWTSTAINMGGAAE